jgi:creatinine amidohydrolase
MRWEHLTAAAFRQSVRKTGVCVLAMGVVEKHGDHLPLGIDYLNVHRLACRAAEKEPAVVFPPYYFGQIYEAACFPGTVAIKPSLLMEVTQNVLDEIGRNGFKKIIILNGHGGNWNFIRFLAQCQLAAEKPYTVYVPTQAVFGDREKEIRAILDSQEVIHGDEMETSLALANFPEAVRMEKIWRKAAGPANRLRKLPPTFTGAGFYADYPEHYAGDGRKATAKKGTAIMKLAADSLARYIKAVKQDRAVPAVEREFFKKAKGGAA